MWKPHYPYRKNLEGCELVVAPPDTVIRVHAAGEVVDRLRDDAQRQPSLDEGGGEEVRWLVTASGRGWGLRGCRQDGGVL